MLELPAINGLLRNADQISYFLICTASLASKSGQLGVFGLIFRGSTAALIPDSVFVAPAPNPRQDKGARPLKFLA